MQTAASVIGEAGRLVLGMLGRTARVAAALWPQLLALSIVGWLLPELALKAALLMPKEWPYLVLAVFSLGFLGTLVCTVLMIRMTATQAAKQRAAVLPGRDQRSTTQLLASTLLPFLGIYAAFNYVNERAREMVNQNLARYGIFDGTLIEHLDPFTSTTKLIMVLLLILGVYTVRRILDELHDRRGWRLLGFLVVVLESYFLLLILMVGQQFLARAADWWQGRRLQQWLDQGWGALEETVTKLGIDLPVLVIDVSTVFFGSVWPVLIEVLAEPLVWLAIAALVMGSRMLDLADVVRVGRRTRGNGRAPVIAREFGHAFLGDLNDKYLPTFTALRMVLRAGAIFFGTYVFAWALVQGLGELWSGFVYGLVGGHRFVPFWVVHQPWVELVTTVPIEVLRLSLLGVAFSLCTERLQPMVPSSPSEDSSKMPAEAHQ